MAYYGKPKIELKANYGIRIGNIRPYRYVFRSIVNSSFRESNRTLINFISCLIIKDIIHADVTRKTRKCLPP